MKKLLKILGWVVGIFLGLVVLTVIGLYLFLPLEDIKALAIEKGEAALGRNLDVETIDLSIWDGLGIQLGQVSVGSPANFGETNLLEAESVDAKLRLWELIKGNYVVDRLIINQPRLQLRKLADGSNNYSFQMDASGVTDEETAERLKSVSPEKQAAATVVAFDQLQINGGQLSYRDDSTGTGFELNDLALATVLEMPKGDLYRSSGRLSITSVRFTPDAEIPPLDVRLTYSAEYDFGQDLLSINESNATINSIDMNIEGIINNLAGEQTGHLFVRTGDVDLQPILASLPESQKQKLALVTISGYTAVETNLDWSGSGDTFEFNYVGTARLRDVKLTSTAAPGELLIKSTVLDVENDQARLTLSEASFDGRPLRGYFAIEHFEEPIVNAELNGSVDLVFMTPFLPSDVEQRLTGLASFDMTVSGPIEYPEKINYVGQLSVTNGSYSSKLLPEQVKSFELAVSLAPQAIRLEKFTAEFESSDISLSGRINNPFPYLLPFDLENRGQAVQPHAELTVTARRLNIDKLFPEAVPGSGALETSGGEVVIDSNTTTIPLPDITASGTIAVDTVIYSEIEFTNIKGKLAVKDRKIRCYDVTGEVYTGQVTGETTVDLSDFNNPKYSGKFKANQIEANDFVTQFSKFGGYLFGKVNMDGNYSASGWNPDAFLNSLSLSSIGTLNEGQLKTSGTLNQALSQLASQTGESFSGEQIVRDLWTNIRVDKGRVYLDDFKTVIGKIGELALGGSYGFDNTLDYKGSILLTEEMTSKLASQGGVIGSLVKLSTANTKRLSVPVVVDGTTEQPSFRIDLSAMQEQPKQDLKDQAQDLLKGLFNK